MNYNESTLEKPFKEIYGLIPKSTLKEFHELSSFKRMSGIFFEWISIVGAVILCEKYFNIPLYLITVFWISARILGLGLIMHDGVHGLVSRNRSLNDWITDLFAAWPIFISMRSYRVKHLAHHKHLNTDLDPDWIAKINPDWQFPMQPIRLVGVLMKLATGLFIFSTYKVMSKKAALPSQSIKAREPVSYHVLRVIYYLAVLSIFIYLGKGILLLKYWIIPIATGLQVLNRMRRIAEHSGIYDKSLPFQTRTTIHGFWARLLLSPNFISYHNEHHLYPGVPFYHLTKLHEVLMSHPVAKEKLHVTQSYVGVYRELTQSADSAGLARGDDASWLV